MVNQQTLDTVARRRAAFPDRPLIRISSTFFWHLGSDFDLAPILRLAEQARAVRARQRDLGRDEGCEAEYPPMKVGEQVQKYVSLVPVHFLIFYPSTACGSSVAPTEKRGVSGGCLSAC